MKMDKVLFVPSNSLFPQSLEILKSNPTGLRSQIAWGFSVPLPDPQVGKSVVVSRTFTTVKELLWYNCYTVCGASAPQLSNGANGDLFLENLYCTHAFQECCSQSPGPGGRPLLTYISSGDTQTLKGRSGSVSCGVTAPFPGSWCI